MIRTIKIGKVLTSIQCSNGFYSNNLYCEDLKIKQVNLKQTFAISLDYSKEYRKKTSDTYDFQHFLESIEKLETIRFYDTHTFSRIQSYFTHNDTEGFNGQVELLIDNPYIFDAKFSLIGPDELEIRITPN